MEESVVLEGRSLSTSPLSITDTSKDARYQIIQSLEGGMLEIMQFKDAVDVITSML